MAKCHSDLNQPKENCAKQTLIHTVRLLRFKVRFTPRLVCLLLFFTSEKLSQSYKQSNKLCNPITLPQ